MYGLTSMFAVQSVFSVLMNLNIGIKGSFSTPFVSYGLRGMLINMACIGLVLAIYRRKDILQIPIKENKIKEFLMNRMKKIA